MVEAPDRQELTSEQLAQLAAEACDDRKAVDIRLIRVDEVSSLADWFVIASGLSDVQVRAIARSVEDQIEAATGRLPLRREGQKEGGEVVMLNERGELASASMANLFWVKGGMVRTPARECGCRAGTVRRWVLERSGQKVEEGRWRKEELDGADEIFLTNARIGIQPVVSWHGKKLARSGVAEALVKSFWAA